MNVDFDNARIPEGVLTPVSAAVFYGTSGEKAAHRQTIPLVTLHEVVSGASGVRLTQGRPITEQALKALADLAKQTTKSALEILPEHVLASSDDWLVWRRPAAVTDLSFDVSWHQEQPGRDKLQGVCLAMALPSLVFVLDRRSLHVGMRVFALERDERPDAQAMVFRAPLLNVNDDGLVCWGNAARPKSQAAADIPEWERLFFSSQFTHVNGSSPVKNAEPYRWIAEFCASGAKEFPASELKPMRKTLGKLIKQLAGERE